MWYGIAALGVAAADALIIRWMHNAARARDALDRTAPQTPGPGD